MFFSFHGGDVVKSFKEHFHLKTIHVQTFHRRDVDVPPVQTNPLLLIPDNDNVDGDDNVDVGDADEDHHSLPWGKVRWCHTVSW